MPLSVSMRIARAVLGLFVMLGALTHGAWCQADVQGQWNTLPYSMTINPIHVALMHNGKILVIAGSGNCPSTLAGCPSGPPYGGANQSGAVVLDPIASNITQLSVGRDMFCNGMTVLADGQVLTTGGTLAYDPFKGSQKTSIFDPATNTFTDVQNMAHGRWYPTVTMLGDGRIMTFSGVDENGNTNSAVEIYTEGSGWSQQVIAPFTPDLYPRLQVLPNGKVFASGAPAASFIFDPSTNSFTQNVATTNYGSSRVYGSSVLLPLTPANNYDPKVMILGGNSPATATTELIDLGASSPAWQSGPAMSQPRIEMDAVLLPTGKVLAIGGSATDEAASTASLNADLYDPATNSFSSAGTNVFARLYHSVALLLPDATVWVAGGNPSRGTYESHMEIYQPAYLFTRDGNNNVISATRPTIASAPSNIAWGGSFTVSTPDAANISQAVLVRPGSSTHAFDFDQRQVSMSFTAGSGTLTVTAPPNGNIAPPGYYMLFILNSAGVPSVGSFVLLSSSGPAPTVSSLSPNSGSVSGGTAVTITGTNFLAGATVSLGGTAATGVTVVSSTSITATTPAQGAGAVSVVVTNTDGQSGTLANGYTYTSTNPVPSVTAITPNSGPAGVGTAVTITGTNFLAGATVSLGGTAATGVTVVSSTSITATTPAQGAGAVSVVVTNTDGQSGTLANGYTYTSTNPVPGVTAITPNSGPAGGVTVVTITGTNFLAGVTVSFGGTVATGVTVLSSTSIMATTPVHDAEGGVVTVVVTDNDGQSGALANGYTYTSTNGGSPGLGLGVASGSSGSATIAAGQTTSYTLSIGGAGISGTASLSCTGAPMGANCSVPASEPLSSTVPATFSVNVTTTSRTLGALRPVSMPVPWFWAVAALGIVVWPGMRAPKQRRYPWLLPLMLSLFWVSCGGGSVGGQQPNPNGTPAGSYTLTVTATSGATTEATSLILVVQ
jgi:hypothetical protein